MEMQDTLINKIASEICGKEREIVNDFCKAFIAQKCLDGFTISTIFDHYQLCVCHDFSQTHSSRYWFEKRDNQPERSKREDSLTFQVPIGSKAQKHLQEAWDICEEMRCSEQSGN